MFRPIRGRLLGLAGLAAICVAATALAQDPFAAASDPVKSLEVALDASEVAAGGEVHLVAKIAVEDGWHLYGIASPSGVPTAIQLPEGDWYTAGDATETPAPKAKVEDVGGVEEKYENHYADFSVSLPIKIARDAEPGERTLEGTVLYMACTEKMCNAPEEVPFKVTLTVQAAPEGAADAEAGPKVQITSAKFLGEAAPGGTATLEIELTIRDGYHIYGQTESPSNRPSFEWELPDWLEDQELVDVSEPHVVEMFGSEYSVHDGKAVLRLPFEVSAEAKPQTLTIAGLGLWQVCDDSACEYETDVPISAELTIGEAQTLVAVSRMELLGGKAPRGEEVTAEVELEIADGWAFVPPSDLAGPTTLDWSSESSLIPAAFTVTGAETTVTIDGASHTGYTGHVLIRQAFTVDDHAAISDVNLETELTYHALGGAGVTDTVYAEQKIAVVSPGLTTTLIGVAILAGLITLITPCVLPLLPVTVSFFSKQEGPPLPRATAYAAGIICTITVIGLIFSASIQTFAQGWVFNLCIGIVFIVLALNLFGVFELRMPSFLIDRATEKSASGGVVGSFFMAVVLALTSFSCSAPFLGILFSDFDAGQYTSAIALLLIYSGTMAAPFFLCSLFPTLLKAMPSAGSWMTSVKITMGFVEFALAFKFLRGVAQNFEVDILSRSFVMGIWVVCAFLAAAYLLGWFAMGYEERPKSVGVGRALWGMLFAVLGLYLIPAVFMLPRHSYVESFLLTQPHEVIDVQGLMGGASTESQVRKAQPFYLVNRAAGPVTTASLAPQGDSGSSTADGAGDPPPEHAGNDSLHWPQDDWDGALARAAEKDRPVLFDFTGVG